MLICFLFTLFKILEVSVCKINFYSTISIPHCHFDWSDSAMEKSFLSLCDYKPVVVKFILLLISPRQRYYLSRRPFDYENSLLKKLLHATALSFRHKSPKSMGFYALEMTRDGILRIKIMVLITFLLKSPH